MLAYFVQLDPRIQQLIALGVTAVFAYVLNYAAVYVPWLAEYLGQHRVAIITWLTGVIVQIIQAKLDTIPATWDGVLTAVMQLIIEVSVVLVGFAYLAKKQNHQAVM